MASFTQNLPTMRLTLEFSNGDSEEIDADACVGTKDNLVSFLKQNHFIHPRKEPGAFGSDNWEEVERGVDSWAKGEEFERNSTADRVTWRFQQGERVTVIILDKD